MSSPSTTQIQPLLIPPDRKKTYAEVVFNVPVREAFTYEVPGRFQSVIRKGMRVFAPFGKRKLTGYVVALSDRFDKNIPLKAIEDLPDAAPVLSEEILSLTRWLADYYQASWGEAIKTALPAGLDDESLEVFALSEKGREEMASGELSRTAHLILHCVQDRKFLTSKQLQRLLKGEFSAYALLRLKQDGLLTAETKVRRSRVHYRFEKIARVASPARSREDIEKLLSRSSKQKKIYDFLLDGEQSVAALAKEIPAASEPLRKLREKGLVEVSTVKSRRQVPANGTDPSWCAEKPLRFTAEQEKAYRELSRSIDHGEFCTHLLHGVTGSGKTEVYLRCIQRVLEHGKTAIMMVPEISLTPQTVDRFRRRFGEKVAILHSGLTRIERYNEWEKVLEGRVSIVVGARSAVFAPFQNLGIVVIDEEHDTSYKQDSTPRYHGRDTAIVRARAQNAVVILGSATPSIESRDNAESGKYRYLSLDTRIRNRLLPLVRVAGMNKERKQNKNFSILSNALKTAIRARLDRQEQTFLFLNRRGTANSVFCTECGYVFHCPRCSVTLTFHGTGNLFRCHYCNHTARVPDACADCRGEVIRFSGFGTQKLEEETRRLFPQARTVRLDRDTTRHRSAFESMHQLMTGGEIDILIGTQMITKGHDFPNVTLVGVVHADLSLNIPDFRSCERSFQLLTQVAGRAGRGEVPGQVIVQTHNPNHYVYDFVREHDYEQFYRKEIGFRRRLNYPPFTRMVALEITSEDERQGEALAGKIKTALGSLIRRHPGVELLGPSRAALYRLNNKFRWHVILRGPRIRPLQGILTAFRELPQCNPTSNSRVKLTIDVDPVNLL